MRERHAYTSARLAELESSAPYANITTEDLQAQRETGELEREDARLALDQAIATRGAQSVLARKLTRDLEAIDERENRLRVELSTRAFAEVTAELGRGRAVTVAEREIKAKDAEAVAGLEGWRKAKAEEELRSSFDDRVARHAQEVEARLWEEGEAKVGSRLLSPGGPNDDAPRARPLSELLAESQGQPEEELRDLQEHAGER